MYAPGPWLFFFFFSFLFFSFCSSLLPYAPPSPPPPPPPHPPASELCFLTRSALVFSFFISICQHAFSSPLLSLIFCAGSDLASHAFSFPAEMFYCFIVSSFVDFCPGLPTFLPFMFWLCYIASFHFIVCLVQIIVVILAEIERFGSMNLNEMECTIGKKWHLKFSAVSPCNDVDNLLTSICFESLFQLHCNSNCD